MTRPRKRRVLVAEWWEVRWRSDRAHKRELLHPFGLRHYKSKAEAGAHARLYRERMPIHVVHVRRYRVVRAPKGGG